MSISLADQIACVERVANYHQVRYDMMRRRQKAQTAKAMAHRNVCELQAVLETLQKLDGIESLFPPEEKTTNE